jgi:hypothetical protein
MTNSKTLENIEFAWVTFFIRGLYTVLFIRCLQGNVHVIMHSCPSVSLQQNILMKIGKGDVS